MSTRAQLVYSPEQTQAMYSSGKHANQPRLLDWRCFAYFSQQHRRDEMRGEEDAREKAGVDEEQKRTGSCARVDIPDWRTLNYQSTTHRGEHQRDSREFEQREEKNVVACHTARFLSNSNVSTFHPA